MARTALPIVKQVAVFVKERKDGQPVFVRRPYDIVELNWGDGTGPNTYMRPAFGRRSVQEKSEVYHDVRFYDRAPDWDLCGGGSDL
jgi:hypothetical protein